MLLKSILQVLFYKYSILFWVDVEYVINPALQRISKLGSVLKSYTDFLWISELSELKNENKPIYSCKPAYLILIWKHGLYPPHQYCPWVSNVYLSKYISSLYTLKIYNYVFTYLMHIKHRHCNGYLYHKPGIYRMWFSIRSIPDLYYIYVSVNLWNQAI